MTTKIAFYGSSLLSAYWNGAATYYRGLLRALAARGYDITFYEPDVYDRRDHRDIDPPDWARVVVYDGTVEALKQAAAEAARADIVVKASGVGYEDELLLAEVMAAARPGALRLFWDVDAPATLAELRAAPMHPLRRMLPELDMVLTYGGGDPVVRAYRDLGARDCVPIYNALDPETHFPVPPDGRFAADLAFLGNRLPDREARVAEFLAGPALRLPQMRFLLGGSGWQETTPLRNLRVIGHVPTADHNAFNATPRMVLNVARDSMAANGFSPATRVFEAAGAGACIVTDAWEGIELFLKPNEEILVARDGQDVVEFLTGDAAREAHAIGERALRRVLAEHTYAHRAAEADAVFRALGGARRDGAAGGSAGGPAGGSAGGSAGGPAAMSAAGLATGTEGGPVDGAPRRSATGAPDGFADSTPDGFAAGAPDSPATGAADGFAQGPLDGPARGRKVAR